MASGAQTWSTSAASNDSIDSAMNWAEGMAPSAVNNSARGMAASVAAWIGDNSGTLATSGTTLAYTVTTKQVEAALTEGYTVTVQFHATNDSSASLAVDSLAAKKMQLTAGTNLAGGEFLIGSKARFTYTSASTAWIFNGYVSPGSQANIVNTANITNSAVTYAKIQNETNSTILGNGSGGSAAPQELVVGVGLSISNAAISAPAFPPAGSFKNLSIKVATTTTVTGAADLATLATSGSTSFVTVPLTGTINFASTGVVNGLDTGALTFNTPYAIYGICQTATSTSGGWLASTSFTTPLMPSGYAYKARLGSVVSNTTTGTAALYGSWQFGREVQYVLGTAGTTNSVVMATTATGNALTPVWTTISTTRFVPTTASHIDLVLFPNIGSGTYMTVAPTTFYGASTSTAAPPPLLAFGATDQRITKGRILLEASSVQFASAAAGQLVCAGWLDNI
jgi:hypothetical protein